MEYYPVQHGGAAFTVTQMQTDLAARLAERT
jgi:hypothetical protein